MKPLTRFATVALVTGLHRECCLRGVGQRPGNTREGDGVGSGWGLLREDDARNRERFAVDQAYRLRETEAVRAGRSARATQRHVAVEARGGSKLECEGCDTTRENRFGRRKRRDGEGREPLGSAVPELW